LNTKGWKTGKQHRIDPRISFSVNYDTWWEGIARIVDQEKEPKLVAEVSNLMGRKYGWNEGLIVELIHH
jgi:hypothetical protein